MRRIVIITILLLMYNISHGDAQNRVLYNFEGIAFTTKGKVLANTDLQLRVWIRNPKAAGAIIYEEYQTISTDKSGVFFMHIGNGKVINGSMSLMGSESNSRFMKIEMASIGETHEDGRIVFKCIKCRRSMDKYVPIRVEAPKS